MKRDEIIREIELARSKGEILDLRKANLYGADLSEMDLAGVDLSQSDLSNANLRGAKLVGTNLSKAKLVFADLSQADVSRADLSLADLREAIITGTIFRGANLDKAKGIDPNLLITQELISKPVSNPRKLSLNDKKLLTHSDNEQILDGIPQLVLPTRWESLKPKIEANNISLRTIVQPVPQAMTVVRNITEYLKTTGGCQVLVIRAETGSGKTTFLNTLPHYMQDVTFHTQTIDLQFVSEEAFGSELEKLKVYRDGINLIILEGREKPKAISDTYIQVVLSNINRFSRTKQLPMLFVIPTIEEQVARNWCDHGSKIGDLIPEHKLYDGSRWYTFPGVAKEKFVEVAKETVRALNLRNIEEFGISTDELNNWADKAPTIGKFIEIIATEVTQRRSANQITIKGKKEHVWIVYCGPDFRHYDHTYLVIDGLCHDEKLRVSPTKLIAPDIDTSTARFWRESIQWAKLVTTINFLDIRLINFPITTTVAAVFAYGEDSLLDTFKQATIGDYKDRIPQEMLNESVKLDQPLLERRLQAKNAMDSLERSNLFFLLREMPATQQKGGNLEEAKGVAQYLHLLDHASIPQIHYCIGKGLNDLLRYHQFRGFIGIETETPMVEGQTDPKPDITVHTETDIYALEFHFQKKQFASSEISRYALRSVIEKYMKALPYLNSQLQKTYDQPIT